MKENQRVTTWTVWPKEVARTVSCVHPPAPALAPSEHQCSDDPYTVRWIKDAEAQHLVWEVVPDGVNDPRRAALGGSVPGYPCQSCPAFRWEDSVPYSERRYTAIGHCKLFNCGVWTKTATFIPVGSIRRQTQFKNVRERLQQCPLANIDAKLRQKT